MEAQMLAELQKINTQLAQIAMLLQAQAAPANRITPQHAQIGPGGQGASIAAEVQQKIEAARRAAESRMGDGGVGTAGTAGMMRMIGKGI